jgi:hypothetical protein
LRHSTVGDYPAIASMLLGRAVLDDLMVFALHVDQCDYVVQTLSEPNGFNEGDTFYTDYLNAGLEQRQAQPRPQVSGRNVHAMSGRALRPPPGGHGTHYKVQYNLRLANLSGKSHAQNDPRPVGRDRPSAHRHCQAKRDYQS